MISSFYKLYIKILYFFSVKFNMKINFEEKQNLFFRLLQKIKRSGNFRIGSINFNFKLDSDVSKCLVLNGEFEKKEIEECLSILNKDSVILDIGANIGFHSVYFAQKAVNGLLIAFEPALDTYKRLLQNTFKLKNIVPLKIALSDSSGVTDFFIADDNAYSSLIDTGRKEIVDKEKVLVYDLDSFLLPLNISKIDLIKIDVEGLEHKALLGMEKTIDKYHPYLFVEIFKGNISDYNPNDTISFVIEKGYKAKVFMDNELIDFVNHDDAYHNYFFIPLNKEAVING